MFILIVGGTGFIGSKLVKALCAQGHFVVNYSLTKPEQDVEGSVYVQGDVREYGTISQTVKKYHIERVVHNAAISHPMLFRDNPYKIFSTNVLGTMNALHAAHLFNVERFIYISSGAVYGNTSLEHVDEEQKLHGENPYGASKVASEEIVRNYGLSSASLRLAFVYGPGRMMDCPINTLLENVIAGKDISWKVGKDQRLDYIYIDDVVSAITKALLADTLNYDAYNVGGGELIDLNRIIEILQKLYPDRKINIGPGDLGYDNLGAMNLTRMWRNFHWKPQINIEQGIARYADWLVEEQNKLTQVAAKGG